MSAIEFAIEMVGRAEGLSAAQIAKLEADAPTFATLVQLSIEAKPLLLEFQALYEKGKPLIAQAMTEWSTVAPDVLAVLAVIGKPTAPSAGPGTQSGGGIGS